MKTYEMETEELIPRHGRPNLIAIEAAEELSEMIVNTGDSNADVVDIAWIISDVMNKYE